MPAVHSAIPYSPDMHFPARHPFQQITAVTVYLLLLPLIRLQQHLHVHPKDLKNMRWYSDQNTSISSTNTSKTIDINNQHIQNIDPKI
jgi:K+-transporting ATPase A subunit